MHYGCIVSSRTVLALKTLLIVVLDFQGLKLVQGCLAQSRLPIHQPQTLDILQGLAVTQDPQKSSCPQECCKALGAACKNGQYALGTQGYLVVGFVIALRASLSSLPAGIKEFSKTECLKPAALENST